MHLDAIRWYLYAPEFVDVCISVTPLCHSCRSHAEKCAFRPVQCLHAKRGCPEEQRVCVEHRKAFFVGYQAEH